MALHTKIEQYDSTGVLVAGRTFILKSVSVTHSINRLPAQLGLPAGTTEVIDLGISPQKIILAGVVDDSGAPSGYANKTDLEDAAMNWYESDRTIRLYETSTYYYTGAIQLVSLTRTAEKPDVWDFNLTFVVEGARA